MKNRDMGWTLMLGRISLGQSAALYLIREDVSILRSLLYNTSTFSPEISASMANGSYKVKNNGGWCGFVTFVTAESLLYIFIQNKRK